MSKSITLHRGKAKINSRLCSIGGNPDDWISTEAEMNAASSLATEGRKNFAR